MRVLSVVHHLDAAAGVFEEPALTAGHELVAWLPHESPPPALDGFDAAIVFGGEAQVDEEDAYPWLRPEKDLVAELLEREVPLLGVCLGSQLVADVAGAVVRRAAAPEIGWHEIELTPEGANDPVLGFLPERFESFGWHYYEWLLPPGAVELARSAACLQAFRLEGSEESRGRRVGACSFTPRSRSQTSSPGSTTGRSTSRGRARSRGDPRRERREDRGLERRGPRDLGALPGSRRRRPGELDASRSASGRRSPGRRPPGRWRH